MRLASLSPAVTEMLFALGQGEKIVCTDQFSNFPEEARDLTHLRDHVKVDPAALREYDVDLIFLSTSIQGKLAAQLKEQGFGVVFTDPRSIEEIYEGITELGTLLDCKAKAQELTLSMQQGFNRVKERAKHLPRRPRLYIEEWHDPPYASGNWVPQVVRIAGGEQFPIAAEELSRVVTLEEVAAYDPDLIVISYCGAGSLVDSSLLTEREGWGALRAVQSGDVRVIDDALLNRPGPRLTEGAERLYAWCFELLH